MATKKITINGDTVVDLSGTTVSQYEVPTDDYFYQKNGVLAQGTGGTGAIMKLNVASNGRYDPENFQVDGKQVVGFGPVEVEFDITKMLDVKTITSDQLPASESEVVEISADEGRGISKVTIPFKEGYLKPSGNKEITNNGENIDIKGFETATVNVQPKLLDATKTIKSSGSTTYQIKDEGGEYYGYSSINLNVEVATNYEGKQLVLTKEDFGQKKDSSEEEQTDPSKVVVYTSVVVPNPIGNGYVVEPDKDLIEYSANGAYKDHLAYKEINIDVKPTLHTLDITPTNIDQPKSLNSQYEGYGEVIVRAVPVQDVVITSNGSYTKDSAELNVEAGKFIGMVKVEVPNPYPIGTGGMIALLEEPSNSGKIFKYTGESDESFIKDGLYMVVPVEGGTTK